MGGFSISGLSGGLDVQGIVQQLMFVESAPIRRLESRKESFQVQIEAYNDLNSKLSALTSALEFLSDEKGMGAKLASTSDEALLTGSADSSALLGAYQIRIDRLALYDSFVSDATFSSSDESIGTGSFDLTVGSDTATITIGSGNNTLEGLRDAINNADLGARASIVNDGAGYRLTIASEQTGSASAISIANNSLTLSDGSTPLTLSRTHQIADVSELDASLNINGLQVTSSSNTVSDAIEGVTLQLRGASPSTLSLTVENDVEAVKGAIESFVEAYNDAYGAVSGHFAYNPAAETAGVLAGESLLRTIQMDLSRGLTGSLSGAFGPLNNLYLAGLELQNDGTIQINSSQLEDQLENNFESLKSLFLTSGQATHPDITFLSLGPNTVAGSYQIDITSLASVAQLTSPKTINGNLGVDETLTFTMDGEVSVVALDKKDKLPDIVAAVNSQFALDGLALTASEQDQRLVITSNSTGANVSFSVVSDQPSNKGTGFGTAGASASGTDLEGTYTDTATGDVFAASGSGNTLTGSEGPVQGLSVLFNGSAPGDYGTVDVTVGFAERLKQSLDSITDSLEGSIHTRVESLEASIRDLDDDIRNFEDRLSIREGHLLAQFARADQALQQLSFLQASIGQQLSQLASVSPI